MTIRPRSFFLTVLLLGIGLVAGYVVGAADSWVGTPPIGSTVAFSWGDHSGGTLKSFYGAHVYAKPNGGQLDVYFTVYIDRPTGWIVYQQDPIHLGRVPDWETAVAKFGVIRWTPTTLLVGDESLSDRSIARTELESHR